ncbi:MAG: RNA methyltransferase, partial [Leptospiraceae bacterium]|nr:RNA methyltransferase [Leptospiraceae bacterium]
PVFLASLEEVLQVLNENQILLYGLSPEAKTFYFQRDFKKKVAFLFGSEQYGISQKGKSFCKELLSIPMKGSADSLNLAMSVGIILYDVVRQRILIS